jgi:preflagellin peptidase FlaK
VSWIVSKYPVFKRWFVFAPASLLAVVVSVVTKTLPISLNPESYILVLLLLLCQMTIRTTIYEKVEVSQLKKGMILTTFSSIPMQSSITKGLPGVSTEDLKSRLTEDEIASIKIWAKATHTETLTIVKKIPFAIFISTGVLLYCAVWGLLI